MLWIRLVKHLTDQHFYKMKIAAKHPVLWGERSENKSLA